MIGPRAAGRCALGLALGLAAGAVHCRDEAGPALRPALLSIKLAHPSGAADLPSGERIHVAVLRIQSAYLVDAIGARYAVLGQPLTIDLLGLETPHDIVSRSRITPGPYRSLVLTLGGAYIEVQEGKLLRVFATTEAPLPAGTTVDGQLVAPSPNDVSVPLPGDGVLAMGEHREVVLDFDVLRSFDRSSSAAATWLLRPTMSAAELRQTITLEVALSFAGHPAEMVTALADNPSLRVTLSGRDGHVTHWAWLHRADQALIATFPLLDPSQGPYRASFSRGLTRRMETDPRLPLTVQLEGGKVQRVSATVRAVTRTPDGDS